MKLIKTSIIPSQPTFAKVEAKSELDFEAICIFVAIGFFLDTDTYWKNKKVLSPASHNKIDSQGNLVNSQPWFDWYSSPRDISFEQALDEFTLLFETIVTEQSKGKKVILPLSGGLDSRTQATALNYIGADVLSYSYEFENGYSETKIAKKIAQICNFEFKPYTIKNGYLWHAIDDLAQLNGCYSDFTSPRQMAIKDEFSKMGDVFSLGHWGDVLFDSMNLEQLTTEEEVTVILKKIVKKGGLQLATDLWETWNLNGDFETYLKNRIALLLEKIHIEDTNANIRAFKSKYWAPRWTSVNLSVFESSRAIQLPYYDDRMCEFICTIPEAYLADRKLQIAYIKHRNPELAKVTWQAQRPFNLYNYETNKLPYNIPYKLINKFKRTLDNVLGKSYIQRNWELQFIGDQNKKQLVDNLFKNQIEGWIPKTLLNFYINQFYKGNYTQNAHPLNMLLVLSKFNQILSDAKTD
ncbi:asparagine synthetase B family protein [Psychroserpens luteus]|uniref:asparagine synthase (glutamine-hydrolyzing) n=1 Tax=Psychroserpens luteus TaxID=1434066 RepID=A0ABW5ZT96_9FLAO|nr:asparagine synthetase B family protein [Psychroserpens luteus]